MGIFSKQGPYQEFKPLFVKEFDAKDTIKTLNTKYSELDTLANINKTPALTYEQQEADKIHAAHQEALNKSVDTGDLSPWKAITMTKGLAHSYANDTDRLKFERSYAKLEEDDKTAGDNPNRVGARDRSLDAHAYYGGSKNQVYTGYTAFKEVDQTGKLKDMSSIFNEDGTSDIKPTVVNGMIQLTGRDTTFITREKVAQAANYFMQDPEIIGDLTDKSYAEASTNYKQRLLYDNPNMSEKELRARTYAYLNTPQEKKETVKYKKDGKIVSKVITTNYTPLQEVVKHKTDIMTEALVGAVAFDKYKNSLSYHNIPEAKGVEDDSDNLKVTGGLTDDFNSNYLKNVDNTDLTDDFNTAKGSFSGLTSNIGVAAVNTLTYLKNAVAESSFGLINPSDFEKFTSQSEEINNATTAVTKALTDIGMTVVIPKLNADGSNINEINDAVSKAMTTRTSVLQQRSQVTVIPVLNKPLREVVKNLDHTNTNIKYINASGDTESTTLDKYITTISEGKTNKEKDDIKNGLIINGVQSHGNQAFLSGSIDGRKILISAPFMKSTDAFAPLVKFTNLTSSSAKESIIPANTIARTKGYTKMVKHEVINPDGNVTYKYSFSNSTNTKSTPPLNQVDFYNTWLQPEVDAQLKGIELNNLFHNTTRTRKEDSEAD
jgi:hypothetical protein